MTYSRGHNTSATERTAIPHWYSPEGDQLDIVDGDGSIVHDADGSSFIDFTSQLYCVNAGHNNRAIVERMTEQLNQIQYVASSQYNDTRTELAAKVIDVAPDSLTDVTFSVSGSEANELAVQFARSYTGKNKILTRYRSYHGATYGSGSLTGDPSTRGELEKYAVTTGAAKFLPPMSYRSPFEADSPAALATAAADHLEFVIRNEDPETIAAIMMEPVAGSSGAYTAPPGYFERVRELCDTYDILFICDEVISGFGRCGDWFGIQTEGVEPDMITMAKGLTSAYAPLAGVLMNENVAEFVTSEGFDLGHTFGGHPVSCAAGVGAIDAYDDGLIDNVRSLEPVFETRLAELADVHESIGDFRGRGFLWCIEFTDPETGEPYYDPWTKQATGENPIKQVIKEAKRRGVLVGPGRPAFQVMMGPPFCTDESTINEAFDVIDESIGTVFE